MAEDANEEQVTEGEGEVEGAGKSRKKLFIIIGIVLVLVLGGGGAAAFFLLGGDPPVEEEAAEAEPEVPAEAIYSKIRTLEGKPMFVVALQSEDGRGHYMQIYVEAKSRDEAVDEALTLHMPLIVARLNTLFSSQNFDELRSYEAKVKMRQDALELVQGIMMDKIGSEGVEEILFTNWVMQ